jgi:hypothetical protein
MSKLTSRLLLWPALALAMSSAAVYAQSSAATGTTSQEMQRGTPGVDVDVGKDARNKGGLPGVDVDVGANARSNRASGMDVDTRASGAGAGTNVAERRLRADRN